MDFLNPDRAVTPELQSLAEADRKMVAPGVAERNLGKCGKPGNEIRVMIRWNWPCGWWDDKKRILSRNFCSPSEF